MPAVLPPTPHGVPGTPAPGQAGPRWAAGTCATELRVTRVNAGHLGGVETKT